MSYSPISIRDIIEKINSTWFLPYVQRPFVWGSRYESERYICLLRGGFGCEPFQHITSRRGEPFWKCPTPRRMLPFGNVLAGRERQSHAARTGGARNSRER